MVSLNRIAIIGLGLIQKEKKKRKKVMQRFSSDGLIKSKEKKRKESETLKKSQTKH